MPFSYLRTFLMKFNNSLESDSLDGNSTVSSMSASNLDTVSSVTDIEFATSSNGKQSLAMKNGVKYSIAVPGSSYFGPYPNPIKGTDWVFCIDFFSKSFGSILLNGAMTDRHRSLAGQYKVSFNSLSNEYDIYNETSSSKYSEFFIFEESTEDEDRNSIHLWIRKKDTPSYYKFKTEEYDSNKWINLMIHFTQPPISIEGNIDPTENYSLKLFINCQDLCFSPYGEPPSSYSNNVQYLYIPQPSNSFDFSLNDRMFGSSSTCTQSSSLVNEVSCFNRRGDECEDRHDFSDKEVFNTYNYGMAFTILNSNKITNSKFVIKSQAMSTVRVLSAEGSSEGQYLGLSDGRLLESKESVWQYSKLLNNSASLEQINIIEITSNYETFIVPGSGIKFTGSIVELE